MINISELWYGLKNRYADLELGYDKMIDNAVKTEKANLTNEFKKVAILKKNNIEDNVLIKQKEIIIQIENNINIVGKFDVSYVYRNNDIEILDDEYILKTLRFADKDFIQNGVVYEKLSSVFNSIRSSKLTTYSNKPKKDYIVNFYDEFYRKHFIHYLKILMSTSYGSMLVIVTSNAYAVEFLNETGLRLNEINTQIDILSNPVWVDYENLDNVQRLREMRLNLCDRNTRMIEIRSEIDRLVDGNYLDYFGEDFEGLSLEEQEFKKELLKYDLFLTQMKDIIKSIEENYNEENNSLMTIDEQVKEDMKKEVFNMK